MSLRSAQSFGKINHLYVNYQQWLLSLLKRRMGCVHIAGDLSQDVFERLLKKSTLPAIHEPRAFLAKIAYGLSVDYRRRAALEKSWLESIAHLKDDYAPSTEEQVIVMDSLANVDAMLTALSPRVRTVFLLSRIEGHSYQYIASELNLSLSSVEKDMAKALRHCYLLLMR